MKTRVLYIKSGNLKWGWWRGLITYTRETWPAIAYNESDPFWALYPPYFIKPIWWGVN